MARHLKPQEVADTIRKHSGLITQVARELNTSRKTVYQHIQKHDICREAFEDSREQTVDLAEHALIKKIQDGDTTAIIFALKTLGKSRGFIERQELTGVDGAELTIKVVRGEDADS